jgi:hypothetical protein
LRPQNELLTLKQYFTMQKFKIFLLVMVLFITGTISRVSGSNPPDEGMWLPIWIEQMNYEDMKKMGLNLTADQVYSTTTPCLKDAVVGLGQKDYGIQMFFCTGELVSDKGLILTNHHCAYDAIQTLSSIEHDYLTNGFWAYRHEEELPIPNMTISVLQRMEDVTAKVMEGVKPDMNEEERSFIISKAIKLIEREAAEKGKYNVYVKSFFEGSEYYLYVYETFRDVRLVGAPPSSIGKFGGDTDNWMWPRHTGDFSFLRVYSAADGTPADYSKDNVPMKPKHYLPVSIKGVDKGDFSMIFGFPGTTDRYLTSYGVDFQLKYNNPTVVSIRDVKLDIMRSYMDNDDMIRIQYASKYAQTANYWKYFIGQTKGLKLHKVYERRLQLENDFMTWVNQDSDRQKRYGNIFSDIESGYKEMEKSAVLLKYLEEAVFQGPEFIYFSFGAFQLYGALTQQNEAKKDEKTKFDQTIKDLASGFMGDLDAHYKDYNSTVDKYLFIALMKMMYDNIDKESHPDIFATAMKKYKGSFELWANDVFAKSMFVDKAKLEAFLKAPSFKVMEADPGWQITISMVNLIRGVYGDYGSVEEKINNANRLFVEGLRLMNPSKKYYPNANSTMRMSYGKILDYYPADAVHYDFLTTMNGIMEKENPQADEFIVNPKLKELYNNKDFGPYGYNGTMPVCFISDNDITGGNSGSPVINGDGHLIGIAFDGNWESMSGDIQYEPSMQRTISVDIRYVLFITEKFAGATNLIDEMNVIK